MDEKEQELGEIRGREKTLRTTKQEENKAKRMR